MAFHFGVNMNFGREKTVEVQVPDWSNAEKTLERWNRRAREANKAHHKSEKLRRKQHNVLGIASVILTACTSASAFTAFLDKIGDNGKIATLILSLASASAVALQTFLKLEEKANAHKTSAAGYSSVRRSIEVVKSTPVNLRGELKATMEKIGGELDRLAKESPTAALDDEATKQLEDDYNPVFASPPTDSK